MRLIIDTTFKTIKIDSSVELGEMVNALEKLFPKEEWKTFRLETNTHIIWRDPIIIRDVHPAPYTYPWWETGRITCEIQSPKEANYTLKAGTFCVEM